MTKNLHNSSILVYNTILGIAGMGKISFEVLVALVGPEVSDLSYWRLKIASLKMPVV